MGTGLVGATTAAKRARGGSQSRTEVVFIGKSSEDLYGYTGRLVTRASWCFFEPVTVLFVAWEARAGGV